MGRFSKPLIFLALIKSVLVLLGMGTLFSSDHITVSAAVHLPALGFSSLVSVVLITIMVRKTNKKGED